MRHVFLVMGLAGVLLPVAVAVLVRRGVRRQLDPLRRTVEAIASSGDPGLRVGAPVGGEIGALGRAIDGMLDALAARDRELRDEQSASVEELRSVFAQQNESERRARLRSQDLIIENSTGLRGELTAVADQVEAVGDAAGQIDSRVAAASSVTRGVVERTHQADRVVTALGDSLQRVRGIADLIADVAKQTNLLALNATIEAARAGEAGAGFAVVATEVKNLATTTTESTQQIAETVGLLERDAAEMARSLAGVSEGIARMGEATGEVGVVAERQHESVRRLQESLAAASTRIEALTRIDEQMERRVGQRVPLRGAARVTAGGTTHDARLSDVGEGGLRCLVEPGTRVRPGERVSVELLLDDQRLSVPAQLAWREDRGHEVELGLQFQALRASTLERVRSFVVSFTAA